MRFAGFLPDMIFYALAAIATAASSAGSGAQEIIDIGGRRELFVDDLVISRIMGGSLQLHHPVPQEVTLVHDLPWEGNNSALYRSVFKDGPSFRMYYMARQVDPTSKTEENNAVLCYAESDDGLHWKRPILRLHEFKGSLENNIVMPSGVFGTMKVQAATMAVFKDDNPKATPEARYKAIIRSIAPKGLAPLSSPDGFHWSPMTTQPVITDGMFDSQNLAFWDAAHGLYRAYWRYFAKDPANGPDAKPGTTRRAIRTATSTNFITWSKPQDLVYDDSPPEELYTSGVRPYYRAPHILLGFPTRYLDRNWSDAMRELPDRENRERRAAANRRYGTALTEGLMMASRDGVSFKRWNEAFLRPGMEREGTWSYGQQYIGWHLIETASALDGGLKELTLFASEHRWLGKTSFSRRYTLRIDGFVSFQAPMAGGELLTKPLRFRGGRLSLNFSTSAAGSVRVEIQDLSGKPVPGFALDDCPPLFGDTLERSIHWSGTNDLGSLAGQPVRVRFVLSDADLYSFQFQP